VYRAIWRRQGARRPVSATGRQVAGFRHWLRRTSRNTPWTRDHPPQGRELLLHLLASVCNHIGSGDLVHLFDPRRGVQ